jgi:hypothetical protein
MYNKISKISNKISPVGEKVLHSGNLAPEYFMYNKISNKIDVYTFGIVLIKHISRRKLVGFGGPKI